MTRIVFIQFPQKGIADLSLHYVSEEELGKEDRLHVISERKNESLVSSDYNPSQKLNRYELLLVSCNNLSGYPTIVNSSEQFALRN